MSGRLMGKVFKLQLDRSQQAIALALADHGQDDGSGIYPGNEYLAWKTGFTERHVVRVLKQLEWLGLVETVGSPANGRGHRQEYRMSVANVEKKAAFKPKRAGNGGANSSIKDDIGALLKDDIQKDDIGAKDDILGMQRVTSEPEKDDICAGPHKGAGARLTVRESYGRTVSTACEESSEQNVPNGATRGGHEFPSVRYARNGGGGMQGQGQMFDAVCAVCRRDPAVISWRSRQDLLRLARRLEQAGYAPGDVARFGQRWYGRTAPTPQQVQDSIEAVLSAREKDHGTGSERTQSGRTRAEQRDADNFEIERVIRAAVLGETDAGGGADGRGTAGAGTGGAGAGASATTGRDPAHGETTGGDSYVIETIHCDFVGDE